MGYLIDHYEGENVKAVWAPLIVVFLIAWNIACMFMDVWQMGADTILQCLCVDKEAFESAQAGPPGGGKAKNAADYNNQVNAMMSGPSSNRPPVIRKLLGIVTKAHSDNAAPAPGGDGSSPADGTQV